MWDARHGPGARSPSRGTRTGALAWRSARTARGSSPASQDKTAKVWDARTGTELARPQGPHGQVYSRGVQPRRLAHRHRRSRGPDGEGVGRGDRARTRSPSRGTRTRCSAWRSARTARASSPASDDRTAQVWDAPTGRAELLTLKGHTGRCLRVAFSPDGTRIVTGERGQDGEGVGRGAPGRGRSPSRGTPAACTQRGVQPRRHAHRHRRARTRRRGCGTPTAGQRSSPSRGTPDAVWQRGVQPGRHAHRHRQSGQDGEGVGRGHRRQVCSPSRATPARDSVAFSPDGRPHRHRQFRPHGAGLGRGRCWAEPCWGQKKTPRPSRCC